MGAMPSRSGSWQPSARFPQTRNRGCTSRLQRRHGKAWIGSTPQRPTPADAAMDRLAQIERGRMQRGGGTARGLREIGHMDLDAGMQEIEAEAEQAIDADLPDPRDMQRNQDHSSRGDRPADDHQTVLPHPRDEKR